MKQSDELPNKAIFLDRDGTVNIDIPYLKDFKKFQLIPGTEQALKFFLEQGYKLFIVTNQSGIARGYFSEMEFNQLQATIQDYLLSLDIPITDYSYCPHHEKGTETPYNVLCDCRKPSPKMILDLAKKYQIDLSQSFMVGDKLSDIQAGIRAGVQPIRVLSGDQEHLDQETSTPNYENLLAFSRSVFFHDSEP